MNLVLNSCRYKLQEKFPAARRDQHRLQLPVVYIATLIHYGFTLRDKNAHRHSYIYLRSMFVCMDCLAWPNQLGP